MGAFRRLDEYLDPRADPGDSERLKWVVLCRSWPRSVLIKCEANNWSIFCKWVGMSVQLPSGIDQESVGPLAGASARLELILPRSAEPKPVEE